MLKDLYAFKDKLKQKGIFCCFNGPISQDLMVELGDTLRQKMELEDAGRSNIHNLFSIVIEKAQNIIHYSAEKAEAKGIGEITGKLSVGVILVGFEDDHYFVSCGNMIKNQYVAAFREKLTRIRGLDRDSLKQHYKEQRKKDPAPDSMGAGLGLIEVARKASRPIEFNFAPVDDQLSFFSMTTVV